MSSKRQELELINGSIAASQTVDFLVHPGDNVGVSVTHDDTTPSPFTFTAAVTDIITAASHGCVTGLLGRVSSTVALPGGLSADTDYYVVSLGTNTLSLATSYANATAAVPVVVNITDTGSGTLTFTPTTGGARTFLLSLSLDGTNFTSSAFFNSNTATTFTAVTVSASAATTLYQLSNLNIRKVRVAFTMADGQASIRLAMASSSNG
jgi:hypothetical protein